MELRINIDGLFIPQETQDVIVSSVGQGKSFALQNRSKTKCVIFYKNKLMVCVGKDKVVESVTPFNNLEDYHNAIRLVLGGYRDILPMQKALSKSEALLVDESMAATRDAFSLQLFSKSPLYIVCSTTFCQSNVCMHSLRGMPTGSHNDVSFQE